MEYGLFGTTREGGEHNWGTIFSITTSGEESVVHSFGGGKDGRKPAAGLTDSGYGTTEEGGESGYGTVYQLLPYSPGYEVLYSFCCEYGYYVDGRHPVGGLIERGGTLYGTTSAGGYYGYGTVFSIDLAHYPFKDGLLWNFNGIGDGGEPLSELTDIDGTLYGTAYSGGRSDKGVVFSVTTGGHPEWLHFFKHGDDGGNPYGGLIDVAGELYGTAIEGGGSGCGGAGCGIIFKVAPDKTYTILHRFGGHDGSYPSSRLHLFNGELYGTTEGGGAHDLGTVFRIKPDGSSYTVVYSFKGGSDGAEPYAGLIDVGGVLFGTTYKGGDSNLGTVFAIKP